MQVSSEIIQATAKTASSVNIYCFGLISKTTPIFNWSIPWGIVATAL